MALGEMALGEMVIHLQCTNVINLEMTAPNIVQLQNLIACSHYMHVGPHDQMTCYYTTHKSANQLSYPCNRLNK
jgi:hypothetical protein